MGLEAYKQSKRFFGGTHEEQPDLDPFVSGNMLWEEEYKALQEEFPNLDKLPPTSVRTGYLKGDMLQALWKLAGEEDARAKQLLDQLNQK